VNNARHGREAGDWGTGYTPDMRAALAFATDHLALALSLIHRGRFQTAARHLEACWDHVGDAVYDVEHPRWSAPCRVCSHPRWTHGVTCDGDFRGCDCEGFVP